METLGECLSCGKFVSDNADGGLCGFGFMSYDEFCNDERDWCSVSRGWRGVCRKCEPVWAAVWPAFARDIQLLKDRRQNQCAGCARLFLDSDQMCVYFEYDYRTQFGGSSPICFCDGCVGAHEPHLTEFLETLRSVHSGS